MHWPLFYRLIVATTHVNQNQLPQLAPTIQYTTRGVVTGLYMYCTQGSNQHPPVIGCWVPTK